MKPFCQSSFVAATAALALVGIMTTVGCASEPAWMKTSRSIMKKNGVKLRTRSDIPKTGIVSNMEAGVFSPISTLPEVELAPGVKARIVCGSGSMLARVVFAPGAEIPEETLPAERIMMVTKGSVEQLAEGGRIPMIAIPAERMTPISGHREQNDLMLLESGAKNAIKAGPDGAEIIEVYSPPRLDYLKKAGAANLPAQVAPKPFDLPRTIEPGRVYNLHELQFAPLNPGAMYRLVAGSCVQMSFLRIEPDSTVALHAIPEEQLRLVVRGGMKEMVLNTASDVERDAVAVLPGGMVHAEAAGRKGCDVIDVFWPPRADYSDMTAKQLAKYHELVPKDAAVELVLDAKKTGPGLCYGEGPAWINGKLYFSSMGYDAKWTGDVKGSYLVEMDPDGNYRYIMRGIETNGTFPMANGNLAVCDMYGHRVIEVTTKGKIVRTIADSYDGKRIDGPNDVCVDMKGGVYFTDPQILPQPHMQPGKSVFYVDPAGKIARVIPPGVMEKPNGVTLSPDNRTLYVNNTPLNFMMAYDVKDDGTLENERRFGKILLTGEIMDQESVYPQTDGIKTDEKGNVYLTTIMGIQIFSPDGGYIGNIHFPFMPVNLCFGGDDGKTLYVNCNDRVYRLRMNVGGAPYSLYRPKS